MYCAQKHDNFQIVHQKCVLCTETEHFPDGTHKAVFTDYKTMYKKEAQRFPVIHVYQHMQLTHNKTIHKLHTAGTALCTPFNLCYVHMLVLRMVADGMQVMNNIKCGIYSFCVRHNLTVGLLRHCAQYGHYFIRQLSEPPAVSS